MDQEEGVGEDVTDDAVNDEEGVVAQNYDDHLHD